VYYFSSTNHHHCGLFNQSCQGGGTDGEVQQKQEHLQQKCNNNKNKTVTMAKKTKTKTNLELVLSLGVNSWS
jgi:hypothetical protein